LSEWFDKVRAKKNSDSDPASHPPSVFLGAFGKHPGWRDYVDIGVESNELAEANRILNFEGVRRILDAGSWDKLDPAQRLSDFNHLFVWRMRQDHVLVGWIWPSRDATGTRFYPMIACVHFTGVPTEWALEQGLPVLKFVHDGCIGTGSAEGVKQVLEESHRKLRQALLGRTRAAMVPPSQPLATLARHPQMGGNHQGLLRIIYQIEREMGGLQQPGGTHGRAWQIRVPHCADSSAEALLLWHTLMDAFLGPQVPLLLITPVEEPWVDVIAGEPSERQFHCIRANLKAIPLTSEIPYSLDEAFIGRAEELIRSGVAPSRPLAPSVQPPAAKGASFPRPSSGRPGGGSLLKEAIARLGKALASRKFRVPLIILAAVIALLVLLSVLSGRPSADKSSTKEGDQSVVEDEHAKQWAELHRAYGNWLADFLGDLDEWKPKLEKNDYLRKNLLAPLQGVEFDPRIVAGKPGEPLQNIKTPQPGVNWEDVARAVNAIHAIETVLVPDAWPPLRELENDAASFKDRGWTAPADKDGKPAAPAEYAAALVSRASPESNRGACEALAIVAEQAPFLAAIRKSWDAVQASLPALKDSGDPLLAAFPAFVTGNRWLDQGDQAGATPIEQLNSSLARLAELAGYLVKDLGAWREIDRQCFVDSSNAYRRFQELDKRPDMNLYSDWRAEIRKPEYKLDNSANPLNAPEWKRKIDELGQKVGRLAKLEKYSQQPIHKGIQKDLDALKSDLAAGLELPCSRARLAMMTEAEKTGAPLADLGKLAQNLPKQEAEIARRADERIALLTAKPSAEDFRPELRDILARISGEIPRIADADTKKKFADRLAGLKNDIDKQPELQDLEWLVAYQDAISRVDRRADLAALAKDVQPHLPTLPPPPADKLQQLCDEVDRTIKSAKKELGARWKAAAIDADLGAAAADVKTLATAKWDEQTQAKVAEQADALEKRIRKVKEQVDGLHKVLASIDDKSASESAAINGRWSKWREQITGSTADPQLLSARMEAARKALARIEQELPLAKLEAQMPRCLDGGTMSNLLQDSREREIAKLLESMQPGDDWAFTIDAGALAAAKESLDRIAGTASDLVTAASAMERLNDDAYGWSEQTGEQPSLSSCHEKAGRILAKPPFSSLSERLKPLLARAEQIRNVAALADEGKLLAAIKDATEHYDAAVNLNAWRKLGDLPTWPDTAAKLDKERGLGETVRSIAAARADDRKSALLAELANQQRSRWLKSFTRVIAANELDGIANVAGARAQFGIDDPALPPAARYDLALLSFLRYLRDFSDEARKEDAKQHAAILARFKPQIEQFKAKINELPEAARSAPAVIQFTNALDELAMWQSQNVNADKEGPIAANLKGVKWELMAGSDSGGKKLSYQWKYGDKQHDLDFVLIEPKSGNAKPFFICTTEMPVGLFIDVIDAVGAWGSFKVASKSEQVTWSGPRAWRADLPGIRVSEKWLSASGKQYPDGLEPPRPSPRSPMQYVTANQAAAFARTLGCRLPTPDEWKAAFDQQGPPEAARCNLRDQTWRKQHDHFQSMKTNYYIDPSLRIFSAGASAGNQRIEAFPFDDHVLWFSDVDSDADGEIHHLVGNVAEFTCEEDKFCVIGGSALSSRDCWDGAAQPFTKAYPLISAEMPYSDVGFRLCFGHSGRKLPEVVAPLLQKTSWIPVASGQAADPK